ncbi:MAG: hypothetical protein ACM3VW_05975 [Bacteroidota bacterium]
MLSIGLKPVNIFAGLLLAVSLLVACVPALAQADSRSLYLESIRNSIEHLESVSPQTMENGQVVAPDPDKYEFTYNGAVSLRRNFARTATEIDTAPMGYGFLENTVTEAGFNVGSRMGLNYSSTVTRTNDLWGTLLNEKQVDVYGLKQSFGSGISSTALGFTRNVTRTAPHLGLETTTRTDAFNFATGLRRSNDLKLNLTDTEIDTPGGYTESVFQAIYTPKLSGGDAPLSLARTDRLVNGVSTEIEKIDLMAPFMWNGLKAVAEHHSNETLAGSLLTKLRTTHVLLPLAVIGKGVSADYLIAGTDKGTGMVETQTAKLINPFRLGGKTYQAEETYITLHQTGLDTETLVTKLTAPLAGGQAVIQRQTVDTETATGTTEQRQLSVVLPSIKVGDHVSVQAQRLKTETVGVTSQSVTNVNLTARPVESLQLEARYQVDDKSDLEPLANRQLHTKWALAKNLTLQGHLTEADVAGGSANLLRLVELVRDRGNSGIGLRAGLASYETPDQQADRARRVEVHAGKASGIAVSAAYSEYDTSNFARYADDALLALSIQHGDPKQFALRWRYEDQPTRVAPLKAVDMQMPALGGSLQMSYYANPLAPDGKTVRQAEQYEAALGRKLFGDVTVQLGYRYLDYTASDLVDQNIRIQLDGGKEDKLGKMAISFLTGDFCTPRPNEVTPGSSLNVSYCRAWGDNSKLTLTLKRSTPPVGITAEDNTEGRLEVSMGF